MGLFEAFLVLGSVISLGVGYKLFHENCVLIFDLLDAVQSKIELTKKVIELEIEILRLYDILDRNNISVPDDIENN